MLALESDSMPLLMDLNKDSLYSIIIAFFLSSQEWTDFYQTTSTTSNKMIVEEYIHRFDPSRYSDLLEVVSKYTPILIQARLNSTILSNKNSLEFNSDDLWIIAINILTQAGYSWNDIPNIIQKINYQNIPIIIPKYIQLPGNVHKSLQYAIKQKLKNIKLPNNQNADIQNKGIYYPKNIYSILSQRYNNQVIKKMYDDISRVILADMGNSYNRHSHHIISEQFKDTLIETFLRYIFDTVTIGTLVFLERQIDPVNVIHQRNLQLAMEKLGGIYKKQEYHNQFENVNPDYIANVNLALPLSTQDDDNSNINSITNNISNSLQPKNKSLFKNERVQKALLGGAAIGLTYLLMNKQDSED